MYCLDTNIVIDIFYGDEKLKLKVKKLQENNVEIFITPLTLCELYKGAFLFFNPAEENKRISAFLNSVSLLDFGKESCEEFGKIYAYLDKIRKPTREADLLIASIAKANNLIFITRDKKHFEHTGVKLEVW